MDRRQLLLALPFLSAVPARAAETSRASFSYRSSVDDTQPLLADAAWLPDGRPKPLLVVMHGYNGSKQDVAVDLGELAARGVFAVAPDMRGCGASGGCWESGGLEVHDILDAVVAAVGRYRREIDPRNLNIVGYSGGGANAIFCAVRFPDLFQTCVSFFGISDYGWWHGVSARADCTARMEKALGGPPSALPETYASRSAIPAAGNARCARLHFFWDEEERDCPPAMIDRFVARYRKSGLDAATVHVSRRGDKHRWIHGYRTGNRSLSEPADALYLPDILTPRAASPRLPDRGRLVVPGYVVTRRFQVWIGDGQQGRVAIDYDQSGPEPRVKVLDNPGHHPVRVIPTSPLKTLDA